MAKAQDALVAVTDAVSSKVIQMAPEDAVIAVTKFPARFSFIDLDPRIAGSATAPAVTGSKGGNAALASLIAVLAKQGHVVDSTT